MTAYFISGQAADERLFENLALPSHFTIKHVHWIEPEHKETLASYCKRLSRQINSNEEFFIIGVSLGGIAAVELNKILPSKKVILISSIATRSELRPSLRFVRLLQLHRFVPGSFYKWYNPFVNWYFGANTKREKQLLREYMRSATKNYMKWAVNIIINWSNDVRPANLFHIHGTADHIFPFKYTQADSLIKGGTHLMVHNRSEEISKLLTKRLSEIY